MATYSIFAIGTAATGSGTLTPAVPAGTLTGKLMLLYAASVISTQSITTPSGWSLLKAGSVTSNAVYGRIGTSSESAPSVAYSASGAHAAFIVAITSSSGWPAIGSVLIDSSNANNSGAGGVLRYCPLAVSEEGLCGIQFGGKSTSSSPGGATAVAVTSGYTAAGTAFNNTNGAGITIAAQMMTASPTVAGDIPQNDVAVTGNTENLFVQRITLTLKAASAGGYTFNASSQINSPYVWLPSFLLDPPHNMGAFAAGDTGQQNGTPNPAGAGFTLGDFGYINITFDSPNPQPITIPFIVNDVSAGVDHRYSLTFNPPPPVVSIPLALTNVQIAVGDNGFTLSAQVASDSLPVTTYVVAVEAASPAPTGPQIIAGLNGSGVDVPDGHTAVAAQGAVLVPCAGLAEVHAYDAWYVAVDAGGAQTTPAFISFSTTGAVYPAATVANRRTKVTPINTGTTDVMDDGSIRGVDVTNRRAYTVEITHEWLTMDQRDLIKTFCESNLYGIVDIVAADGYTYRCPLDRVPTWEEQRTGARINGALTIKGNRL